jgi:hypothetical protein
MTLPAASPPKVARPHRLTALALTALAPTALLLMGRRQLRR